MSEVVADTTFFKRRGNAQRNFLHSNKFYNLIFQKIILKASEVIFRIPKCLGQFDAMLHDVLDQFTRRRT